MYICLSIYDQIYLMTNLWAYIAYINVNEIIIITLN